MRDRNGREIHVGDRLRLPGSSDVIVDGVGDSWAVIRDAREASGFGLLTWGDAEVVAPDEVTWHNLYDDGTVGDGWASRRAAEIGENSVAVLEVNRTKGTVTTHPTKEQPAVYVNPNLTSGRLPRGQS
jgi:hypothetical protein